MNFQEYFNHLKKPPLAPPSWLFGVVWPVLYVLILISYGSVFYKGFQSEVSFWFTLPFIINLLANFKFTYLQFKLKNNFLALIDILMVLTTIIITIVLLWPNYHILAYMQIPYLTWVCFATYLQVGITYLNKK